MGIVLGFKFHDPRVDDALLDGIMTVEATFITQ